MMNWGQKILLGVLGIYRKVVSPALTALFNPGGLCRFTPSCSEYAVQAIQLHGAARGSWLGVKRLCRCHPWGECGPDPVPPPNVKVRVQFFAPQEADARATACADSASPRS